MSRSQGIGIAVVTVVIGGVVAWSLIKSGAPRASGITMQTPPQESHVATSPPDRRTTSAGGKNTFVPSTSQPPPSSTTSESPIPDRPAEIVVQVAGAVHRPGVYHLKADARNDDALNAAGGPTSDANTASVNLAARAQDGSQIYIKTTKEQPTGGASDDAGTTSSSNISAKKPEKTQLHSAKSSGKKPDSGSKPAKLTNPSQGKININTANVEDLERIPGIGPSMAERLIAYRQENHGFQSAEDLMQVSGIGEKKFAKMQPFVRVH